LRARRVELRTQRETGARHAHALQKLLAAQCRLVHTGGNRIVVRRAGFFLGFHKKFSQ